MVTSFETEELLDGCFLVAARVEDAVLRQKLEARLPAERAIAVGRDGPREGAWVRGRDVVRELGPVRGWCEALDDRRRRALRHAFEAVKLKVGPIDPRRRHD